MLHTASEYEVQIQVSELEAKNRYIDYNYWMMARLRSKRVLENSKVKKAA